MIFSNVNKCSLISAGPLNIVRLKLKLENVVNYICFGVLWCWL